MKTFPSTEFCIVFHTTILPMLLWIDSYYLPVVRAPRPGMVTLANCDIIDWTDWKQSTNPSDWLAAHSVSIEQFIEWRDRLLFTAYNTDPCPNLYLLFRSMPFDHRDRFAGRLRLAYDLYEMAELMRLFIEDVTEVSVRKEWDPRGHPDSLWVERLYGSQPRFGDPGFLRPLVRHYGLDPAYRIMWLVEGDTEEAFIAQYNKRLGTDISGFVTIQNFGGDSALRSRVPAVDASLETAKREQRFVTLTFDDSRELRGRVESLMNLGLINIPFVLSNPDFELGNFQTAQLIEVALTWARDVQKPIGICREELVNRVNTRISEKNRSFDRALNDILHCEGEEFRLSKGSEWGQRLANYLSDRRDAEVAAEQYTEKDLTSIEQQIFRVSWSSQPVIDYPSSVFKLDPSNLEIRGTRLTEKDP